MQVMCDGVPVCEFNQQDQPELSVDETDMPPARRPVSAVFSMSRKDVRRMNAVWRQKEAVVWRYVASKYGWTTKRMRRMKKSNKVGNASLFLILEELYRFWEKGDADAD